MRLLAENEARRQKKDEEIRQEHLERDNAIVEKSCAIKWSNRDSIKAVTRAVRATEVIITHNIIYMRMQGRAQDQNLRVERVKKII